MTRCTAGTSILLLAGSIAISIVLAVSPWIKPSVQGRNLWKFEVHAFQVCTSVQVPSAVPDPDAEPPPLECVKYEELTAEHKAELCCDVVNTLPALGALTLLSTFMSVFAVVLAAYSVKTSSWMFAVVAGAVAFGATTFTFVVLLGMSASDVWDKAAYEAHYPPGAISGRIIVSGVNGAVGSFGGTMLLTSGLLSLLATGLLLCCNMSRGEEELPPLNTGVDK